MTCCIEDVTFIGFKCKYADEDKIPHKSWINITAEVHVEFAREYKGKGPGYFIRYPSNRQKNRKMSWYISRKPDMFCMCKLGRIIAAGHTWRCEQ